MGLPPTTNLALRRQVADRISLSDRVHRIRRADDSSPGSAHDQLCAVDMPLAQWRLHGQNDQNSTRITPRRLERELKIMDALWLEQKHYLKSIDPDLAASFPGIDRNPLYLKMNYIRHRLNNDPAVQQRTRDLCRYGLREIRKWIGSGATPTVCPGRFSSGQLICCSPRAYGSRW